MRASGVRAGDTILLDGVHLFVQQVRKPVTSDHLLITVHGETYPRAIPEQADVVVLRASKVRTQEGEDR